jgi:hypothetical protein
MFANVDRFTTDLLSRQKNGVCKKEKNPTRLNITSVTFFYYCTFNLFGMLD